MRTGTLAGMIAAIQSSASTIGDQIDLLFVAITGLAIFFSVGIFLTLIFLAVRYRRGAKVDRSNPPTHNTLIEIIWSVIPLTLAIGIFIWSSVIYMHASRPPSNAMEIHVVGKQWMWKIQHPSGRWENNELHLPVGRPVKFIMTSEDVIHSFYIPEFRVKMDVIPGRFTQMWVTPTKTGTFNLFCAEFCGALHSVMGGTVTVMEQDAYETWLTQGDKRDNAITEGSRLFRKHGCSGCHAGGSAVRAPLLEGIFGRQRPVQIPQPGVPIEQTPATTVTADLRYLHDAIVLPEKEVAAGYRPIMPTYKNRMTEEEILKIVAYIRSMGSIEPFAERKDHSDSMGAEDYNARTGFVPDNLEKIQKGVAGESAPSETMGTVNGVRTSAPNGGGNGR